MSPTIGQGRQGSDPTTCTRGDLDEERRRPPSTTTVDTAFSELRCNHRVLFGQPVAIHTLTAREGLSRARYVFTAGTRFGLDLWRRNAYGTVQWRCFVCEALRAGEAGEWIPRVTPAVRVLLSTKGTAQSRLFLAWLQELEAEGFDPVGCVAEVFEAAHFRLAGSRADRIPPRRLSGRL